MLSTINGGGKWVELAIEADPIYQTILIPAEKAFRRAVNLGGQTLSPLKRQPACCENL
jgi:hypothetical protein